MVPAVERRKMPLPSRTSPSQKTGTLTRPPKKGPTGTQQGDKNVLIFNCSKTLNTTSEL